MAQPPRYDRAKDFTADYADETDHAALNAELDGAAQSINSTRDNLALLQRDDGALKNGVVTSDSLAPALKDELISEVAIGIDDKVQQAQAAANDAVNASLSSQASAANSQTYAEQSLASAGSAQANAQSAGASKAAAALSETNAAASAASALASKNSAGASETNASASAASALASKNAAGVSETNTAASESAAAGSAASALDSKNAAATSASAAATSETAAAGSATAAAGSATTAEYWAGQAEEIATGVASNISVTPAGNITATDVQTALEELDTNKLEVSALPGENYLINSDFYWWQRGTTQSLGGYGSVDRWGVYVNGSTINASRGTPLVGSIDGNPLYCWSSANTSVAGANNGIFLYQQIENVARFKGKYTFSFWAMSDAARPVAVEFLQAFGTGGSPSAAINSIGVTKITLSNAFARYTVTVDLPDTSAKTFGTNNDSSLWIIMWMDAGSSFNGRTNSLGQQSGNFYVARAKFEQGEVATPYVPKSYSQEYLDCCRYYWLPDKLGLIFSGDVTSGGGYSRGVSFPVPMRTTPTVTPYYAGVAALFPAANPAVTVVSDKGILLINTANATGVGYYYATFAANAELP